MIFLEILNQEEMLNTKGGEERENKPTHKDLTEDVIFSEFYKNRSYFNPRSHNYNSTLFD